MVELGGVRNPGSVPERVATTLLHFLPEAWPGLFLFLAPPQAWGKKETFCLSFGTTAGILTRSFEPSSSSKRITFSSFPTPFSAKGNR